MTNIADQWTGLYQNWFAAQQAIVENFEKHSDPLKLRQQWLQWLTESMERFLRSPGFLESMDKNLKFQTELKNAESEWSSAWARQSGVALTKDLYEMAERSRQQGLQILERLEAIEDRLAALESKLDGSPVN